MTPPLDAVLFDFDGTIVDTTELIHESMRRATSEVLGRQLDRETLMANVGQPLPRQMELLDAERAGELLQSYRHHNEGLHEAWIREFPSVNASLARLRAAGLAPQPRAEYWGAPRSFVRSPAGHRVEVMAAPPA